MRNSFTLATIITLSLGITACDNPGSSSSNSSLQSVEEKASYSFGVDIATRLKQQGVELEVAAFNKGISDAFNNSELALSDEERQQAKLDFQAQLRENLLKQQSAVAEKNLQEGKAFLEANAKKEGVITTDSGLQYKVITSGSGKQPTATDTVTTNYRGTLIDGREFDSSYSRNKPASFPVKGVIKGWTEALQMMHVGDKWQLFVPSELAYGASKRSELIQANSTLIFEIELLGIKEQ